MLQTNRDPLVVRLCLAVVRTFAVLVPAASRWEWRAEWEAEVRHRWHTLDRDQHVDWRTRMDLFRRALGALPDAAPKHRVELCHTERELRAAWSGRVADDGVQK